MLIEPARPRPSLQRDATMAAFVSQLLAERDRLPPQREKRRATPERATNAYADAKGKAIRRMPVGYRTSIVA